MKTAISLSEKLFKDAEKYARTEGLTRSKLYALALAEFLRQRKGEAITNVLNEVYATESSALDKGFVAAQEEVLPRDKW